MNVPEFLSWADAQESGRYELVGGEIVAMAPERLEHVHAKRLIAKHSMPQFDVSASRAKPMWTGSA